VLAHTAKHCSPDAIITRWNGASEIATGSSRYSSCCLHQGAARADAEADGYSTAQFGQVHEVPVWQNSPRTVQCLADGGRRRVRVTSTGSSAARITSGTLLSYEGTRPSRPPRPPPKATTSPKILTDKAINWAAPAEGANGWTNRSSCTFAPVHARPPRAEGVDRQVHGQVRSRLDLAVAKSRVRAAERHWRHCADAC